MAAEHSLITVLIVEEDSINRSALAWLLKELGFHPILADGIVTARNVLAAMTPKIVILDLILPDGNGIDLLAEIRRACLPIVVAVVTGVTDQLKLHELTAWEPEAIFGKPLDIDDFDDWLVKQLSRFAMNASRELPEEGEG